MEGVCDLRFVGMELGGNVPPARRSVRESSFFAKSQLTLQTWLMLLHFWSRQNPVSDTAECAKVALNMAVDVYQWLREVCSTRLINDGPVMLGGPGVIVQMDESLFKHRS